MAKKKKAPTRPKLTKTAPTEPGWYWVWWDDDWYLTFHRPDNTLVALSFPSDYLRLDCEVVGVSECTQWFGPLSPPKPIRRAARAGR